MDGLTAFGLLAVTAMLVTYAVEDRSPWFNLGICWSLRPRLGLRVSAGSLAVGLVEAIWALVAARRWWLRDRG
jgi:hypothetical protein